MKIATLSILMVVFSLVPASAAIVHSTASFSMEDESSVTSSSWNIDGNGSPDFIFLWFPTGEYYMNVDGDNDGGGYGRTTLGASIVVTPSDNDLLIADEPGTPFTMGTNYIAAGFIIGGSIHYAWAEITITDAGPPDRLTFVQWAYETDADTPIVVGAVPEPGETTAGLAGLALGVAALRRWRKKSKT